MKNLKFKILVLFVLFLTTYNNVAKSQNQRERIQQQKARVEREISNTNKLIQETKRATTTNLNQVNLLQTQISNQVTLLRVIETELQSMNAEINKLGKEIANLENELKLLREEYAKMIYYSYLTRNSHHRLMFIFASKSMNEAFVRLRYLQEYTASRKRQVELIVSKQEELEKNKKELEQVRAEKFSVMKQQEQEVKNLAKQKEDKDKAVSSLRARERELLADLRKKQTESARLQKQIEDLIKKEIEEANRRKNVKKVEGSAMPMTTQEIETSRGFSGNRGRMPWPVDNGAISSKFGEHPHPVLPGIKVKNNGIDIVTRNNTQVRAVFNGNVSAVFSLPNGNKAVILRHGEFLTVYSNMSSVNVKKDDAVKLNEVIGVVTADNEDNTSVFHFEIWREKSLENPENWLIRR